MKGEHEKFGHVSKLRDFHRTVSEGTTAVHKESDRMPFTGALLQTDEGNQSLFDLDL